MGDYLEEGSEHPSQFVALTCIHSYYSMLKGRQQWLMFHGLQESNTMAYSEKDEGGLPNISNVVSDQEHVAFNFEP